MIAGLLSTAVFQYVKCQDQRISKNLEALSDSAVHEISEGAYFSHLGCQGGRRAPLPARQLRHWATGQLLRALRCKGAPRDEIYLFQIKYSFEKFRNSEAMQ